MPPAWGRRSSASQIGGDQRTEFDHPAANRFSTGFDPALGQKFLNVADA
jgi:hypothetical protein